MLFKTSSFLAFFLLVTTFGISQNDKLLQPKKMQTDLDLLVELIDAHPKPYRHISADAMQDLIDSTRYLLTEPLTVVDFFKTVSPIYHAIKDGHTSLRMPRDWMKNYRKKNGVFPYRIHINDENRIFVIENFGQDETISPGAEILAINDLPTADFLESVSPYLFYEIEIFRNSSIELNFDFYLLLQFGEITEVKLDYHTSEKQTHILKYIPYADWKDEQAEEEAKIAKKIAANLPYEYKKIREDVGYLKIWSFGIGRYSKYEMFLRNMFRDIRKDGLTSLIIDVRGNTGGSPRIVSDLIHCLSDKYFKYMAMSEMKVSKVYQEYYSENIPQIDYSQINFRKRRHSIDMKSLFNSEPGTLIKESDFYNEPPREEPNEFKGDIYLLTDRRSYSASSSFAASFQCYRLGLIVGSETGGTKVFHASSMRKKLQNSNLLCSMATARRYTACFLKEDEPIKPDLEVKPTVQHLIMKRDAVLDYTLRVIDKVKRMREE